MIPYSKRKRLPHTIPEVLELYEDSGQTALICGNEQFTYRELMDGSRKIARALVERGVRKGDRVVLSMHRNTDFMFAYLGVILAGGVQVSIHSGWTDTMKARVLSDCTPVLTIDDAAARKMLEAPENGKEISLPVLSGEDPFQIIYTSGSTGMPKGVEGCQAV